MEQSVKDTLIGWANEYNDPKYFTEDPIIFPKHFAGKYDVGEASVADVEIAALLASHLAWGRRSMIVRDCERMMDEMCWKPYDYVMNGEYRDENVSLEGMTDTEIRCKVFGQKEDMKAPNKKISMMRRWMVRDDGKVDLGVWKASSKRDLILPLDVHVYTQASALGLTARRQKDIVTAREITDAFKEIWPDDPCLGDYALFGYGVTHK